MTWPLTSTVIVGLSVFVMLAWYERTRPTPSTIAILAAMTGLAVAGRVVFAPIPGVKPTTDIILLTGVAFGAAPAFTVGAITALISNVAFGQGPWTPWQMMAWGAVGMSGALLAPMLRRHSRPVLLAAWAAAAGFAFGVFMDFSLWALYAPAHTLSEFLVLAARGLPFNIAHAAGNAGFALVFGGAMLAALRRAKVRAAVTWVEPGEAPFGEPHAGQPSSSSASPAGRLMPAGTAVALVALTGLIAQALAPGLAGPPPADAAAAPGPVTYLLARQNSDGGFRNGASGASDPMTSGWATMALGATATPDRRRRLAAGYVRRSIAGRTGTADIQRAILALRAVKGKAVDSRGRNLVTALRGQQLANGSWNGLVNQTAFGILALRSAGAAQNSTAIRKAVKYLNAHDNKDGGFNFSGRGASTPDDTAGAVQALVSAGQRSSGVTKRGVRWLSTHRSADGGWGGSGRSNAQSTAWGAQALIAAGVNVTSSSRTKRAPVAFLRTLRAGDGHIRFSRTSDQTPTWVTAQAQLAIAGTPLPVRTRAAR